MLLGTKQEWTIENHSAGLKVKHPFHIHVNPFQIVELFDPNTMQQPLKLPQPWIWWDTFAIPSGRQIQLTCTKATCAPALQPYLQCPATGNCKEFIPGWFKMRSRFVDFTGQYVLHCHILIHEDRGMMQLVEVISDKTMYTHH